MRRFWLVMGALLVLGAPLGASAMCVHTSRPVARSLQRGGGTPHGMPGCSPSVAWMLAPIQREVVGWNVLYGLLGFAGFCGGIAVIVERALARGSKERRP
ncbi:MAG: hypothetical protein KF718_32100 [Polyangiaceae bacterium]|nr:hypothetical protein [Polyangiaceae bacterium]